MSKICDIEVYPIDKDCPAVKNGYCTAKSCCGPYVCSAVDENGKPKFLKDKKEVSNAKV